VLPAWSRSSGPAACGEGANCFEWTPCDRGSGGRRCVWTGHSHASNHRGFLATNGREQGACQNRTNRNMSAFRTNPPRSNGWRDRACVAGSKKVSFLSSFARHFLQKCCWGLHARRRCRETIGARSARQVDQSSSVRPVTPYGGARKAERRSRSPGRTATNSRPTSYRAGAPSGSGSTQATAAPQVTLVPSIKKISRFSRAPSSGRSSVNTLTPPRPSPTARPCNHQDRGPAWVK
jgi:hypothetical protein